MPETQLALAIARVVGIVAIAGAVWFGYSQWKATVTAPVQTKLDVAEANNAGFKAAATAQNVGIDKLQTDGAARKKKSEKAVQEAGKPEFKAAEEILAKPAPGPTPLDRAVARINAELGL